MLYVIVEADSIWPGRQNLIVDNGTTYASQSGVTAN